MSKLIKTQRVSNIHIVFFFRGKLKVHVCNKLCIYLLITLFTYIPIKNWYFFLQLVCLSVSPRCDHSLQLTDPGERDLWCQKVRGGRQCAFSGCPHWGHLYDKRAPVWRLHVWGTTQRYDTRQHWKEISGFLQTI